MQYFPVRSWEENRLQKLVIVRAEAGSALWLWPSNKPLQPNQTLVRGDSLAVRVYTSWGPHLSDHTQEMAQASATGTQGTQACATALLPWVPPPRGWKLDVMLVPELNQGIGVMVKAPPIGYSFSRIYHVKW